jgi:hypothetical protein
METSAEPAGQPSHHPASDAPSSITMEALASASGTLNKEPSIIADNRLGSHHEPLDRRDTQREPVDAARFFRKGRVFAILAHTDQISGIGSLASNTGTEPWWREPTQAGLVIHSFVRRFVVIREGQGFCSAIPINTYNGQGCTRRGLKESEITAHAIVYFSEGPPKAVIDEPALSKTPICITLSEGADDLSPASRINFRHVSTVQHNVRAMHIGKVATQSRTFFEAYWQQHLLHDFSDAR